jgi:regulator of sigma E protease
LRWAEVAFRLQELEIPKVKLLVRGNAAPVPSDSITKKDIEQALKQAREIEFDLGTDLDWPLHDALEPRGLPLLIAQDRIAIADSFLGAMRMGLRDTYRTVVQIYLSLRSLVTRRVSATEHLQGPIDIVAIAYRVAERNNLGDLALLLGIIGVNLAVVNFLPIPVLDGGHMLFLIYEKLRGRPASEAIRLAANWFGLVVLVGLMGFVIYLGVVRLL